MAWQLDVLIQQETSLNYLSTLFEEKNYIVLQFRHLI